MISLIRSLPMDWILSTITIISFILIGRKMWQGFALSVANGVLWILYGIALPQVGLIPSSVFLMVVNGYNMWKWYKEERRLHAVPV